MKHYDQIIIGAGAAGLYYAALCPVTNGLILEKSPSPGRKLLLSGSGQCNLTHGGSIKDYISHYGANGKKIRTALYRANNLQLRRFWEQHGLVLTERDDGKVFPDSLKASDVLDLLLQLAKQNGWQLHCQTPVCQLTVSGATDSVLKNSPANTPETSTASKTPLQYCLNERYVTSRLIVAAGGCSYPDTGSDGSMLPLLQQLGISMIPPHPSLSPITVQEYPYADLSGISFPKAVVSINGHRRSDGLLLTHSGFSGPAVLNLSRYATIGDTISICYTGAHTASDLQSFDSARSSGRTMLNWLPEESGLPKRFCEILLKRIGIDPMKKAASLSRKQLHQLHAKLTNDAFSISGTGSFRNAMATCGGIDLSEIDLKTFEAKRFPGLYIIGELLDIDGDTGGYNLQFAFSSAWCASHR